MRVTFLAHSGFLVELPEVCLLFDYWKGELPSLPESPLAVFVSHRHPDHFDPAIFSLAEGREDVTFVLSKDIRPKKLEKLGLPDGLRERVVSVGPDETFSLPGLGLTAETLRSTDEGVAFVVTCGEKTLYHAGDLNWWSWEEESDGYNRNMEVDFKRYLEPLRNRHLDVAFVPLDPRLGDRYGLGLDWLLRTAQVDRVFPMHLWNEFGLIERFRAEHPDLSPAVVSVEREGQSWSLPD